MPKITPDMVEIEGQFYAKNHPKAIAHRQAKSVAGLRPSFAKSDQRREGEDCRVEPSKESVRFNVTFTVYRRRPLDAGDNDRSALKPIRDAVATLLGFPNDNVPGLTFEYHQIKSRRDSGTHILIEAESV